MKALFSVFKIRWRAELQYRGAVLGGILCQLFFGLIMIAIYQALYATKPQSIPFAQIATYVWLQQAFFRMLLGGDAQLSEKIASGGIAYDLCRPIGIYGYYYVRDMATRIVDSGLRAGPMIIFALLLPEGWRLSAPASPLALLLALISLLLGLLCACSLGAIARGFTLLTLDGRGIEALMNLLMMTLSGNILPLTLFPDSWQTVIRLLPYAQLLDAPVRIYTGAQPLAGVPGIFALQLAWGLVLMLLGRLLWKKNEKRLVLQGG